MKKVLFVGHFSEQTKQMQKELAQFVKIQLCSDNVTIAESMMSIYEPDLVLVNVEGFTDSHLEFFQVLAEKYALGFKSNTERICSASPCPVKKTTGISLISSFARIISSVSLPSHSGIS